MSSRRSGTWVVSIDIYILRVRGVSRNLIPTQLCWLWRRGTSRGTLFPHTGISMYVVWDLPLDSTLCQKYNSEALCLFRQCRPSQDHPILYFLFAYQFPVHV